MILHSLFHLRGDSIGNWLQVTTMITDHQTIYDDFILDYNAHLKNILDTRPSLSTNLRIENLEKLVETFHSGY